MDPSRALTVWKQLRPLPLGRQLFSRGIGRAAPYSGTVGALVTDLELGFARVELADRRRVRNHLDCIHAVALMNLGELATGLATLSGMPPGGRGIVVDLGMEYTKKARGTIVAESRSALPTTPGDHEVQVTAILRDRAGDQVALARATWRVQIP